VQSRISPGYPKLFEGFCKLAIDGAGLLAFGGMCPPCNAALPNLVKTAGIASSGIPETFAPDSRSRSPGPPSEGALRLSFRRLEVRQLPVLGFT
jgi:hypothetical protein